MEDLIARKVSGIAISVNEPKSVEGVIQQAIDAGIKVVTFDSDSAASGRSLHIGTINKQAGVTMGNSMGEKLGGKGKVAIITGQLGASNLNERIDGVKEALAAFPDIEIVATEGTEDDLAKAVSVTELQMNLDPTRLVGGLSIGQKQMVEIAQAISYRAKLIIMDEPTASLSHHEATTLMRMVKSLAAQNIGVVYISHRLDEIFEIGDRVTVLRDGMTVDCRPIGEMTRAILIKKMVDRELSQLFGEHVSHAGSDVLLSVKGLGLKRPTVQGARVSDVSFDLHKGEVLGFFGLVGSGRTEIMEMIFGSRPSIGTISIDGKVVSIREPSQAIAQGIGFVTEDRKELGLVLGMSVRENFSLTHLSDYCRLDVVSRKREINSCVRYIRSLDIKTPSSEQKVLNLSGGNQQKVVIAKWVARRPRILIVDEPTRGIDVGAKAEVHMLLNKLASEGMSIIVVSSDLPEVLAISDRVVVLKEGRIAGILPRAEATQERVMLAATG